MDQESTFLAGDIGGTKTLLGIYSWHGMPKKKYQKRYISSDWPSIEPMIKDFIAHAPNEIKKPNFGCLGVAGRVINNFSSLTNLNWELYSTKIASSTNLKKIELINDFTALIYALPFLQTNQHTDIQNGAQKIRLDGVVAVIGAGTGLGIARGFLTKNSILALPSEGGHTEFAPRSKEEWLFSEWLKNELNLVRLSIERVISGTGLGYIAKWMIIKSNLDHPLKTKAEIWPNHSEERIDFPSLASPIIAVGKLNLSTILAATIPIIPGCQSLLERTKNCLPTLYSLIATSKASFSINNVNLFLSLLIEKH